MSCRRDGNVEKHKWRVVHSKAKRQKSRQLIALVAAPQLQQLERLLEKQTCFADCLSTKADNEATEQ